MIEKIISISNVGTFSEYKPAQKYKWDGKLSKINLIYAPNGSGKTTLSTIFNSLSNVTPEILTLKQTINKIELPNVKLKYSGYTGITEYNGKKWSENISNVLVFDIHFIEDYLFLSSISNEKNNKKLLFLILGNQGSLLRNRFFNLRKKHNSLSIHLKALENKGKNNQQIGVIKNNLQLKGVTDKVIVFDDPLSSFDYLRKTSTINILSKLAQESLQFILTTHDINFAKGLKDKLSFVTCLNLKIDKNLETSFITTHDIDFETLNGYQKDLITIKSYKGNLIKTEEEKRKVVRCIRPIIETIFKVKYNDDIVYNEWLGDIIGKIRKSADNSHLGRLKTILPDIIDLNDYTKKYHHSEFDNDVINDVELDFFIDLLQKTVMKI